MRTVTWTALGLLTLWAAPTTIASPANGADQMRSDMGAGGDDLLERFEFLERELQTAQAVAIGAAARASYFARFEALAREGCVEAGLWCLDHLPVIADSGEDPDEHGPSSDARSSAEQQLFEQVGLSILERGGRRFERWCELVLERSGRADGASLTLALCDLMDAASRGPVQRARLRMVRAATIAPWNCTELARQEEAGRYLREALQTLAERAADRGPDSARINTDVEAGQLRAVCEERLWRLENLSIGKRAPLFVSADARGNEIRLSDYLDKVTVVRFWGFTLGDPATSLAVDRELRERFWDQRFALIGVNSDSDRNAYLGLCKIHEVHWTNAWEGSQAGPVAQAWHITEWPTTIVLDAVGIVRFVGVGAQGRELIEAVDSLVRLQLSRSQTTARVNSPRAEERGRDESPPRSDTR